MISEPIVVVRNWNTYAPQFRESEFACRHCNRALMAPAFMDKLHRLRMDYGKPMTITSGYRCPDHPAESSKADGPGAHAHGRAADVAVSGAEAFQVVRLALAAGFTGIGVAQKGASRFIHLDDMPDGLRIVRPMIWSY